MEILMMSKASQSRFKEGKGSDDFNNQLITFDSKSQNKPPDSELKLEDLETSLKQIDRQLEMKIHLTSDFGWRKNDFECQTNFEDPSVKKKNREINKWKKAYLKEKENNKLTKTVLDQALALSMKLLNEVKTLDVKLYKEKEKNKKLVQCISQNPEEIGARGERIPIKTENEEASGSSYTQIIRKSTEEIENIIRKIQFDSGKKSVEKPPQPPKIN